jgi:hypothetical protein
MSNKNTLFYKQNQAYLLDFTAEDISSDSSIFLADKIERKHGLVKYISRLIPDNRDQKSITHTFEKILKQRAFNDAGL